MKVQKEKFDALLSKVLKTKPVPRTSIKASRKRAPNQGQHRFGRSGIGRMIDFARMAKDAAAKAGHAEMSRRGKLGNPRKYRPCRSPRNPRRSKSHQFRSAMGLRKKSGLRCVYCGKTPASGFTPPTVILTVIVGHLASGWPEILDYFA